MKTVLKVVGSVLLLLLLLVSGAYLWASTTSSRILSATYESHEVEFPIPYPLSAEEIEGLALDGGGAAELARERAIERGRHLLGARYACAECHGANLGGGVMIDAFPVGTLLGPNLTLGEGSRTRDYTPGDWDRAVRHGILPDGRPSAMPSSEFRLISDQELSDIVTYIRSLPPVDNLVPAPRLGPLGKVLMATGQFELSADLIDSHHAPHRALPPEAEATVEFGAHLIATCTACHGMNLAGGPIAGGDPSWATPRNLTPDASGLGSWSFADFVTAMQEGIRPDGTSLLPPMTLVVPFARQMTSVELEAMWMYLRSLPPVASE